MKKVKYSEAEDYKYYKARDFSSMSKESLQLNYGTFGEEHSLIFNDKDK